MCNRNRIALWCVSFLVVAGLGAIANAEPQEMPQTAPAAAIEPAPETLQSSIQWEWASYSRVDASDPGTVRVFLSNSGNAPHALRSVSLNGILLKDIEDPVSLAVWHALFPTVLQPGQRGVLLIKLTRTSSGLLRLGLEFDDGATIERALLCRENPVRVSYVGFSPDLMRVSVYVENTGDSDFVIRGVQLRGVDQSENAVIPASVVHGGEKTCVLVKMQSPLEPGAFVSVRILGADDEACEAVVRAISLFPCGLEQSSRTFASEMQGLVSSANGFDIKCSFLCPAHAHGSWSSSAQELLETWLLKSSAIPSGTINVAHLCRRDIRRAWPVFAQAADVSRVNVTLEDEKFKEKGQAVESIAWFTDYLRRCAMPRPFYATVSASKAKDVWSNRRHPEPEEVRIGTYLALAGGAKGIFYRDSGWTEDYPPSSDLLAEIGELNAEIARIRPELIQGDIVSWGKCSDPKVRVGTILSGHGTVVVFLVNTDFESNPEPVDEPFKVTPKEGLSIDIRLPAWLKPSKLNELTEAELQPAEYTVQDGIVSIPVDRLDVTQLLILSTELANAGKTASK